MTLENVKHIAYSSFSSCYSLIYLQIIEINSISLRNSISHFKLIQLCLSSHFIMEMATLFWPVIGALNTVGRYIVNMTRGGQEASITNNNPTQNVPDAILTLTTNVLGQNVTNQIEPMIKRIGVVETRDDPALLSTTISTPATEFLANATLPSLSLQVVDAKKKKKQKQKTKRKDTPAEQLSAEQAETISESRKI